MFILSAKNNLTVGYLYNYEIYIYWDIYIVFIYFISFFEVIINDMILRQTHH